VARRRQAVAQRASVVAEAEAEAEALAVVLTWEAVAPAAPATAGHSVK
jgi:hypothetical protein